jgi:uncharacterized protein (DUF1697 family)
MHKNTSYISLLRGINVGGHHKVPMAELQQVAAKLGFENVQTILNSGNLIFDAPPGQEAKLEEVLTQQLEKAFGFPIPVLIRNAEEILELVRNDPFKLIQVTKDTRLYISFLKQEPVLALPCPWTSADGSYRILEIRGRCICSVLDLAGAPTPKAMDALEQFFGKNITNRNWNTMLRIANKIR